MAKTWPKYGKIWPKYGKIKAKYGHIDVKYGHIDVKTDRFDMTVFDKTDNFLSQSFEEFSELYIYIIYSLF